jgi:hypothetical protein
MDLNTLNKYIGKEYNCTGFVAEIFPQTADFFLKKANPDHEDFNFKEANKELNKICKQITNPKNNKAYIVSFDTKNGISVHLGVLFNDKIYHSYKGRIIAQNPIYAMISDERFKDI